MKNLIYITAIFLILSSCSNDDDSQQENENNDNLEEAITQLPEDVSKLYEGKGDINANTVIIYEQGGPDKELDAEYFETGGSFNTEYVTFFKDYYRVYAHQALTYNSDLCSLDKITKNQADLENSVSIEILDRLIKHFKNQNKTVYVMGHSFGGFVVTKYIANKGNMTADKFLIMGSRLDMQIEVAESFSKCEPYYFLNGSTPKPEDRTDLVEEYEEIKQSCSSIFSLLGSMGSERFTTTITVGDLSNVIYVFAKDDTQTGGLLGSEKMFLDTRNAQILEIANGGHGAMFDDENAKEIGNLLIQ